MTHSNTKAASFLQDNLDLILDLQMDNGVLDLACGQGRNGLFLLGHNVPVTFADNSEANQQLIQPKLDAVSASVRRSEYCLVDFEADNEDGCYPLDGKIFDAVLVFNYLHRPLFPFIKRAIRPGGLIVYETFTVDQPQFGRPSNPDYLLHRGELLQAFYGWQILKSFEGELAEPRSAKARLIARKPAQ